MTTPVIKSVARPFIDMIRGKVFTGEGKASEFLGLEPYRDFISEKAGFEPYPGTLNVRTVEEDAEQIRETSEAYRMEPTEYQGRELGGLEIYRARINGEKCVVVQPDLTRYGDDVLEVVAPFKIREKFDLEDGDEVRLDAEN